MNIWRIVFWIIISIVIILSIVLGTSSFVRADSNPGTNIDSTLYHAWSDVSGWWDFHNTHTAVVGTSSLSGYASSSIGDIALNCNSTPSGDICSTSNFKVTNPDGGGNLSGCAWNDTIGWVSFWCGDGDCDGGSTADASSTCASSNYRVTINATGTLSGYAWNDIDGWISFNCENDSSCAASNYKVKTSWAPGRLVGYLESSVINTEVVGGATLNSIMWQGEGGAGTIVDFQIATSSVSNPASWTFFGPGGDSQVYYDNACPIAGSSGTGAAPNTPICVERSRTANSRYIRYKVRLQSNTAQNSTPVITDIILNWGL